MNERMRWDPHQRHLQQGYTMMYGYGILENRKIWYTPTNFLYNVGGCMKIDSTGFRSHENRRMDPALYHRAN